MLVVAIFDVEVDVDIDIDVEVDVDVEAAFELGIPLMSCRLCRAENGSEMNVV